MEYVILGIYLILGRYIKNEIIHQKTKVIYKVFKIIKLKWQWAAAEPANRAVHDLQGVTDQQWKTG